MGIEIEVSSLEEMCALMCDNRLPRKKPRQPAELPTQTSVRKDLNNPPLGNHDVNLGAIKQPT